MARSTFFHCCGFFNVQVPVEDRFDTEPITWRLGGRDGSGGSVGMGVIVRGEGGEERSLPTLPFKPTTS